MDTPSMHDVAIIGGGVVGCCIARALSRYALEVVLIEREVEVGFGTTKTNSGIIHAGHHTGTDTLKGRLVVRGNALFDGLQEELGFGFSRIGEIVVARSEEDLPVLEHLHAQGQAKGVPVEWWDTDTLRREEPNLSPKLIRALHAPTAGVINPYEFAFALIESAMANGVALAVECPVESMDVHPDHIAIHTPERTFEARYVLNCAGVFADQVAAMVGLHDFTIHPRKGEEYMLDARLKGLVKKLVFPTPTKKTKGTLIIPTFDGTIMVGPTAQDTEDRHDLATTPEGAEAVFSFVRQICPSIDARDTIAEFAGLRAVSSTNDFIIGTTAVRGFLNVAGIQSPGLTAAPAIAEYVLELLGGEGLPLVAKRRWQPRVEPPPRFAQRPVEEQRELAASDRAFGHMVCRCEMVTVAEIQRAMVHGARTLDGVKFRTRAGMGRCQGGFCTTRVMEVLAERLGVSFHEVTKRGGGSWLVVPMDDMVDGDPAGEDACSDA